MSSKIHLSPPDMGGEEMKFIKEAIDSNWVAPAGENILYFERDLELFLGENAHVTALSSGTAAIHLALIMAGVKTGDTVICQSLTFAASAFPILYQGATPVFIDSEEETWNICPVLLEEAITDLIKKGKKPKAIIVVHIFGMPAKMDEIIGVSKKHNISIIEDAAESLGSEYKGQKCGTFGDFGVLSFNGNKIITTSGGGALVCKDNKQKEQAVSLATQAKDNLDWYEHSRIGYNYRMSNILAGIGRGQMKVLAKHIDKRRKNNSFYYDLFKPYPFISVKKEKCENFYSNYWLTCIVIEENEKRKTVKGLKNFLKKLEIQSKYIWKPLHLQPVFEYSLFYGNGVSERIFNKGLCLPSGSNLKESEKELITKVVLQYLDD